MHEMIDYNLFKLTDVFFLFIVRKIYTYAWNTYLSWLNNIRKCFDITMVYFVSKSFQKSPGPAVTQYRIRNVTTVTTRGVATLGSNRHVPTHNFHKSLRKICKKLNVYIFLVSNLSLLHVQCHMSIDTEAVIDQFNSLHWKIEKWILSEAHHQL